MKSFTLENSSVTFKFLLIGLASLCVLSLIFIFFALWYIIHETRKRREEKLRRAQFVEDTKFIQGLQGGKSAAGKGNSKIDVGFTSQQTLNQDPESGERRPTFSRFLNLWKGLRTSKRKAGNSNEEPRRSVVFTIPTEDVFPKTHTKQQTYYAAEDNPTRTTDGLKAHTCDIHHAIQDINEDRHDSDEKDLEIICENKLTKKTCYMEMTIDANHTPDTWKAQPDQWSQPIEANNEVDSSRTSPTLEKETQAINRTTSDERQLHGTEGKSFSKESDVDSGCGTSCHEIYATETTTHAQLNVTTLAYCHAQKIENEEYKVRATECSNEVSATSLGGKPFQFEPKTEYEFCSNMHTVESGSNKLCSQEVQEFEPQVVVETFEELIKLAKDGMSTLARKRVDKDGKSDKKTIAADCFQATTLVNVGTNETNISDFFQTEAPVENRSHSQERRTKLAETLQDKDKSLSHSATESQMLLNAQHVDSAGVKYTSSTSSCLDNDTNMGGKTLCCISTEMEPDNFVSSSTCVVEIPTIVVESEPATFNNSLDTASESTVQVLCPQDHRSLGDDTQVNSHQCVQTEAQFKPNQTFSKDKDTLDPTKKTLTLHKQTDRSLRIEQSCLHNGATEKADRPQSLVIPSTCADKTMYALKVPSLETLNLPSHEEHTGRIRSFSATIRRKLSFRERVSSDDMDIEKQDNIDAGMQKNKKLKGFRSLRVNKKKRVKEMKRENLTQSTGSLDGSNSNKYWTSFDKIFHENTGSTTFSDVPFTIPEISEQ